MKLSNVGQTSKSYLYRHRVRRHELNQEPGVKVSFRLFFADKKKCYVRVYQDRKALEKSIAFGEIEACFISNNQPSDPQAIGLICLHLDDLSPSTVVHEIVHACVEWMRKNGTTATEFYRRSGDEDSPYEVFAHETGEMVQQFWECLEAFLSKGGRSACRQ